jgi:enolase-phosphatase E1
MRRHKLEARCVLLDIEGTVSDIQFVYDVMFPFARDRMHAFLLENWHEAEVQQAIGQIIVDAKVDSAEAWLGPEWSLPPGDANLNAAADIVHRQLQDLMSKDSKSTGLKQIQGLVWKSGFEAGQLRAELFPDVLPSLQAWYESGLDIRIYSSGSILAQKLFFAYTTQGDLTRYLSGHYDTTIGPKKESASYVRIASDSQFSPSEIIFVTDVYAEVVAAKQAGLQAVASVRPGNIALPAEFTGLAISSLLELEIAG